MTDASVALTADPNLLPAESIALTVALAQVRRGEVPTPNVASVCVLALARIDGRYDYTKDDSDGKDFANL
jgi:hypothetical protein